MKKRIYCFVAVLCALLLLLSSCASTYTAVLYGGGGGNTGIPGLPGVGGSQGGGSQGGGGGSQDQEPLPSDHLFHEPPLDTVYEGFSDNEKLFIVNFSAGLSQAMGKGKYLFQKQSLTGDEYSAVKKEVAGKKPYLTVGGEEGYALYALAGHENLKRVAINCTYHYGRRLEVFEYTADASGLEKLYQEVPSAERYSPQWVEWLVNDRVLLHKKAGISITSCQDSVGHTSPFWISPEQQTEKDTSKVLPQFYGLSVSWLESTYSFKTSMQKVVSYKVAVLDTGDKQSGYRIWTPSKHLEGMETFSYFLQMDQNSSYFSLKNGGNRSYQIVVMALDENEDLLTYGTTLLTYTSYAEELKRQALAAGVLKPTAEPSRHRPDWITWLLQGGDGKAPLAKGDIVNTHYWHPNSGSPSAFTITHYDAFTDRAQPGFFQAFAMLVPLSEESYRGLAEQSDTSFLLAYRKSGSGDPFTVEQSRCEGVEFEAVLMTLRNSEGVLNLENAETSYEFVLVAYDRTNEKTLFYKHFYARWTDSSQRYFDYAVKYGYFK